MERYVVLVFSILFARTLALPPSTTKQYRSDYVYNRKTNAFYKLHIEENYKSRAIEICQFEGAKLIVPSRGDIEPVHAMMKQFPDIGDVVWMDNDGLKHNSDEETPMIIDLREENDRATPYVGINDCEVITRKGEIENTICFRKLPFVCKVEANTAVYDEQCQVYGSKYVYYSSVGSCYMVSQAAYTWDQAYAECRAEGAHLVVLNSDAEHQAVWDILRTAPRLDSAQTTYFFHAGIRANKPTDGSQREFRTIFNETLEQAGYAQWTDGEPNNYQDSEYCGTLFRNNGKYNDVVCTHLYSFMCEKESNHKA